MNTEQTITSKAGVQKIGKNVSNELPQVKDANINVRDVLNDILLMEKHNLVSYQIGINEMIDDNLRQIVMNNRDQVQQAHTKFFNEIFNLGEYQANVATSTEVQDLVDIFTGYQSQFPLQQ